MTKNITARLAALEAVTAPGMPPALHLDGSETPGGWMPGTTRETADTVNASTRLLRECLGMDDGSWDDSPYIIAMRDRRKNA